MAENEDRARLLWCFMLEQALLIEAFRDADADGDPVHEYLVSMLRQGPHAEGLVAFAGTAQGLADELARGDTSWDVLLRGAKDA